MTSTKLAGNGSKLAGNGRGIDEELSDFVEKLSDFDERLSDFVEALSNYAKKLNDFAKKRSKFAEKLSEFAPVASDLPLVVSKFASVANDFSAVTSESSSVVCGIVSNGGGHVWHRKRSVGSTTHRRCIQVEPSPAEVVSIQWLPPHLMAHANESCNSHGVSYVRGGIVFGRRLTSRRSRQRAVYRARRPSRLVQLVKGRRHAGRTLARR